MADVNTNVVITVSAKADDAITQITELKKQTDELKKAQASLDTTTDDGKKKFEAYNAVIKANNAEIRSLSNATQNMAKEQMTAAGSIDQLRAQVGSLTKEYTKLSQAERDSAKGQELKASIKTKTDELKGLEKAIGDNRRNVGNYADSIKEAAVGMNLFGVNIGSAKDGLSGIRDGFKSAGGGVKGFGMALATLGLPLIIAGIQTLMSLFSRFRPIVDAVERATAAMGAAFSALISGGSMTEAAEQASKLTAELQGLQDAENLLAIQQAQTEVTVKRLITASKDRGKTEEQRIALLKAAAKTEEENFKAQSAQQQALLENEKKTLMNKYDLSRQEIELLLNARGKKQELAREELMDKSHISDEELKSLTDKQIKIIQLEGQSLDLREKIQNRENALVEGIEADKQKAIEATKKKREEAAKKAVEAAEKQKQEELKRAADVLAATQLIDQLRIETIQENRQKDLFQAEAASAAKLQNLQKDGKLTAEIITLEQEGLRRKLADINAKYDKEDLEKQKEQQAKLKEAREKAFEAQQSYLNAIRIEAELSNQSTLESDLALLEAKFQFDIQNTELTYERKLEIEAEYNRNVKRLRDTDAKNAEQVAKEKAKAEEFYIGALVDGLGMAAQAMGQNTVEGKGLLIAQTLFSTYSAAQKAFESQVVPLDPTSTVRAFIAAALATTAGLARVGQIASTPVGKFAKGGIIGGKPHSEGGTKFYGTDGSMFEAERGELLAVVNKYDTPTINTLSNINSRHGTPFGAGKKYLQSGGFVATEMGRLAEQSASSMMNTARKMPTPIVRVSEINSVQNRVNVRELNSL